MTNKVSKGGAAVWFESGRIKKEEKTMGNGECLLVAVIVTTIKRLGRAVGRERRWTK